MLACLIAAIFGAVEPVAAGLGGREPQAVVMAGDDVVPHAKSGYRKTVL